uniref:Uncharacterized protein n=1 Tax=Picea sitchensis TaxID=3332 RepID=D5A819_PICSI|nr:unknown [Picea sitchensis]
MNQQRFACLKPFTVPFLESMAPWLFVPGTAGIQLVEENILEMVQYRATYGMGRIGKKKMDIKDELSDELQAGLKDATNLMGNLGKRLAALELQVEGLTTALGKISDATAEASKKDR